MDQTWARWALWLVAIVVFVLVLLVGRALMARFAVLGRRARLDPSTAGVAMTDDDIRLVLDDIDEVAMRRVDEAEIMLAALRSRAGADRVHEVDAPRRADRRRLAAWALEDHTAQGLPLHVEIGRAGAPVLEPVRASMVEALRVGSVQQEELNGAQRVILTEIHVDGTPWWVVTADFGHSEVEHVAYPAATNAAIRYDRLVRRLRGATPDR